MLSYQSVTIMYHLFMFRRDLGVMLSHACFTTRWRRCSGAGKVRKVPEVSRRAEAVGKG